MPEKLDHDVAADQRREGSTFSGFDVTLADFHAVQVEHTSCVRPPVLNVVESRHVCTSIWEARLRAYATGLGDQRAAVAQATREVRRQRSFIPGPLTQAGEDPPLSHAENRLRF